MQRLFPALHAWPLVGTQAQLMKEHQNQGLVRPASQRLHRRCDPKSRNSRMVHQAACYIPAAYGGRSFLGSLSVDSFPEEWPSPGSMFCSGPSSPSIGQSSKFVVPFVAIQVKKGSSKNVPEESIPPRSQNLRSPTQTPRDTRQLAQCRIVAEGRQLSAEGPKDEGEVHQAHTPLATIFGKLCQTKM